MNVARSIDKKYRPPNLNRADLQYRQPAEGA